MTTIAFKNGVIAADSQVTVESDAGGARNFKTKKLFRRIVHINGVPTDAILATAGESAPGSLFVEQWSSGKSLTEIRDLFAFSAPDFSILVVTETGLFEIDKWCVMEPVYEPFYAIGSGAKLAMGAMEAGASAQKAVEIACRRDPYTALPVVTMRLKSNGHKKRTPMPKVSEADVSGRQTQRQNPVAMQARRRALLQHDQSSQARHDTQREREGRPVAGVQPPAQPADETLPHHGGAERDSSS